MARTWVLISLSIAVLAAVVWFGPETSRDSAAGVRDLPVPAPDSQLGESGEGAISAPAGSLSSPSIGNAAPKPLWSLDTAGSRAKAVLQQSLNALNTQSALLISLPSGNDYTARVVAIEGDANLLQVQAKVAADNYEGFALITESEGTILGTFNTPEGVYELFGQPSELTLVRASDLDGERRLGVDFQVKDEAGAEPLPQKKIQTPVPKT